MVHYACVCVSVIIKCTCNSVIIHVCTDILCTVYDPLMGNLTFVAPGCTKRGKFHSASANTALHYFAECKLTVCIYVLVYCL